MKQKETPKTSPRIIELKKEKVQEPQRLLSFCEALGEAIAGKNITRVAWNDTTSYGCISDDKLLIHLKDRFYNWIVVTQDIEADDWIVLE